MKKKTFNLLAQVSIIVLLLPFVAVLLRLASLLLTSVSDLPLKFFEFIPFSEVWAMFFNYAQVGTGEVFSLSLTILFNCFLEAVIMGAVVHITMSIADITELSSLPLLRLFVIFLGVIVGGIISGLLSRGDSVSESLGAAVIVLIGIIILLKSIFKMKFFSGTIIVGFIINGFLAIIASCYLTTITAVAAGVVPSLGRGIALILASSAVLIAAIIVSHIYDVLTDVQNK